jgi:L-alanine-DL-glutamate epimerase-like enolase superfamily enzyme
MKISDIKISVFELPTNTAIFDMEEVPYGSRLRWQQVARDHQADPIHVLHVYTDAGIEGICTVGDARYTSMRSRDLEHLRALAIGQDPLARERLDAKLRAATRHIFTLPGWHGAFDNCLWDIAGKVAQLPVCDLIGRTRKRCPAYYNFNSSSAEAAIDDSHDALEKGFTALKDHWHSTAEKNVANARAVRRALGDGIPLFHDAASAPYTLAEALHVGRALEELGFTWFEEPIADRDIKGLQQLCAALDIPILAPETLMHELELSALWLQMGATDLLRANARHGTTAALKLAHCAQLQQSTVEFNGPGGLFGLVHAHVVCAVANTSYYEYFPRGSRDEIGREIGLLNPPVPVDGHIIPPSGPGWGAEWDWDYFEKKRVAIL